MDKINDLDIIVHGRASLFNYKEDRPHIVIAAHDPGFAPHSMPVNPMRLGFLPLAFWDLDRPMGMLYDDQMFTPDMAYRILRFVEEHRPKIQTILCACEAGISRSSGMAAALSRIYNHKDQFYFDHYLPNRRVFSFILARYYE